METQQSLQRRMQNAQDLQSVVKTMKALAAVNIRQYEKAMESLREYYRTIELGLSVVMRDAPGNLEVAGEVNEAAATGAIIYGSEQGMAGQFNKTIAAYTKETLSEELGLDPQSVRTITLGTRIIPTMEDLGFTIEEGLPTGGSASDVTPALLELLLRIERWRREEDVGRILLFYNRQVSGASFTPEMSYLLPINPEWLQSRRHLRWEGPTIPTYFSEWRDIFAALVRQYFFVSLYRGFIESLASENASRLSTMQAAESNIEDKLSDLQRRYNRQRQKSITEELMDIITGFQALQ